MNTPRPTDPAGAAHDNVYKTLRSRIMYGEMEPGKALTLRGIASEFEVSMTPAREALRRLSAEGALTLSATGRVSTPELSNDRIEELASVRALIEPELGARALPRVHMALIDRLRAINENVGQAIAKHDGAGYVRSNLEFHRTLYLRAQAPAMLAIAETLWLQLGPTMPLIYRSAQQSQSTNQHRAIIAALRDGDETQLRLAIRTDVTQGLRHLLT